MNRGIASVVIAYTLWGVYPLYFRLLGAIPSFEMLMHRVVWSLVVLGAIWCARRRGRWLLDVARSPRMLGLYATSSVLIGLNWYFYIYATQNGHVLDSSLGSFITPLFSILVARIVLGERPRPVQWTAVAIAAIGVLWMSVSAGRVPWISLGLATTFSAYSLAKKTAPLGAIQGLTLETAILAPLALAVLGTLHARDADAWAVADTGIRWLIVASGPLTTLPMLLFAFGARRIPMTTLGVLQYLSPTMQFVLGALIFHEPFTHAALVGYASIWTALALYAVEGVLNARRAGRMPARLAQPARLA
jgi:chloramphenicol-sensitive protein RarD